MYLFWREFNAMWLSEYIIRCLFCGNKLYNSDQLINGYFKKKNLEKNFGEKA